MQTITSTKGDIHIPDDGDWVDNVPINCTMVADGKLVQLTRITVVGEDDNEKSTAVEYWLDAELIHRSAHVTLKPQAAAQSDVGRFE